MAIGIGTDRLRSRSVSRVCAAPPEYVANEIIVKFRPRTAAAIATNPAQAHRHKCEIKSIRPVFKNFREKRQQIEDLLEKDIALLTEKEKHLLKRLGRAGKDIKVPELDRIYKLQVELPQGLSLADVAAAYKNDPDVEYAELNYIVSIRSVPNDPLYPVQWALNNTGQSYPPDGQSGTADSDIDAPQGWDTDTGSYEVVAAVLDTGVDYRHRDLDDNMWVNSGEIADNNTDDDENGFVDDIYGYDFYNDDPDPLDDNGHGTHCSGIIAAEGNNGFDIAGVCWQTGIMALKFLDSAGNGDTAAAAEAIYYAVENGADIISNSWGGRSLSQTMKDAIDYAHSQGVIMVAAAGNDDSDLPFYPAGNDHTIAVAATDSADSKASFSNYGDWVDIAAPGVDILSVRAGGTSMGTVYDGYTTVASGTSMACPHVAGACALLLSNDGELTSEEIYDILTESADPISQGICLSDGRLNLFGAIMTAKGSGHITFDRDYYSCSDEITIELVDFDLKNTSGSSVTVITDGGDLETVTLTQTSRWWIFSGTIPTAGESVYTEDGILQLSDGEVITATYSDISDGAGNPAIIEAAATADCKGPQISNIRVDASISRPIITFQTDEPSVGSVQCALACGGPYTIEQSDSSLTTSHTIQLAKLEPETEYFFIAGAADALGNQTWDTNLGQCHTFTTIAALGDAYVPGQFATIQEAIDNSWDGGTVWVADGTYTGEGNYDIDFKGLAITVRSQNGPADCIIDCHMKGRGFVFHNNEDSNSVLDGFTIRNGYATRNLDPAMPDELLLGGGIYCLNSSPAITDCKIVENYAAYWGGGLYAATGADMNISNCTFSRNRALLGGGIFRKGEGIFTLTNCTISDNDSDSAGGGINCYGDANIINCTITDNTVADGAGGGITAAEGLFHISNSNISRNFASAAGGIFFNQANASMENCIISENTAQGAGGLLYNQGSYTFTNCTIVGNTADYYGGGIYCSGDGNAVIGNCILFDNSALEQTEEIYIWPYGESSTTVYYCDIQDGRSQIYTGEPDDPNVLCVFNWGTGNIDARPDFAFDGDFHLTRSSACIDAGTNDPNGGLPPTDADGNARPLDGDKDANNMADMGAYEFNAQLPSIALEPDRFNFSCNKAGINPRKQILSIRNCGGGLLSWKIIEDCPWLSVNKTSGTSTGKANNVALSINSNGLETGNYYSELMVIDNNAVNNPRKVLITLHVGGTFNVPAQYSLIQEAINASRDGDVVLVADGTYTGNGDRDLVFYGRAITVKSENGPENCIINCEGTQADPHRGFAFWYSGEDADSIIEGLTITGGYVNDNLFAPIYPIPFFGGAIFCEGASPTINNCVIKDNYAAWAGGGLFFGAAEQSDTGPRVSNCIITGNRTSDIPGGGGLFSEGKLTLANSLIAGNVSTTDGGGVCLWSDSGKITNCTISNNSADGSGGGISAGSYYLGENGLTTVTNCIVWGNTALRGHQISVSNSSGPAELNISYSDVTDGPDYIEVQQDCVLSTGKGNISLTPRFAEPGPSAPEMGAGADYHLLAASPCINAGDPNYAPEPDETDLDGNLRLMGDFVDMGAYEFFLPVEAVMKLSPATINFHSSGDWVKACFVLPLGFLPQDVDVHTPAVAEPMGIESKYMKVFGSNDGFVNIEAGFERSAFFQTLPQTDKDSLEITVTGSFTTGRRFYGTDTIRITGWRQGR